jgi:RNA polymerase sigma factor (sigma-70 family)
MSQESVEYACTAGFTIISLDNTQNDERSFYETIAKDENISQDDKIMLYDSLDKIPEEERKAIIASYLQDKTQDKIAKELNTSQVRVSRLIDRGLDKMRILMKTA